MSKTTNTSRKGIRWQLLASVSATALLVSTYGVEAADSDRPQLWIELGGQLERLSDAQEPFSPPFMASITQANLLSALNVQQPPGYALSEDGAISFQPDGSDWVFSASIHYGRSAAAHHKHQQTKNAAVPLHIVYYGYHYDKYYYPSGHVKLTDGKANKSERHLVLDFQAGKDVGLGMFGKGSTSILSAGVRIAQLNSKSTVHLSGEPDLQYPTAPITTFPTGWVAFQYATIHFHDYTAVENDQRSFRGMGPSLRWNVSVPVAGNTNSTELTLDWGANAALLFGRQKARGHRQTATQAIDLYKWHKYNGGGGSPQYQHPGKFGGFGGKTIVQYNTTADFNRERSVTVPNLGGFAGISLKWTNAKISLGYKADFFFGAIDGGLDTRKSENRAFYGPYASISVGLGD